MNYTRTEQPERQWMVQGNRKCSSTSPQGLAAIRLGELAKEDDIRLKLGSYGELVPLLAQAGARVICHTSHSKPRETKIPEGVDVVDCYALASQIGGDDTMAWHIRLDAMTRGIEAAIYFPGGPGTRLHMTPIGMNLANISRQRPLHVPKVALIGWTAFDLDALLKFWKVQFFYESHGLVHQWATQGREDYNWLASFDIDQVDKMVEWLLAAPATA